jgi:diguanylate cyclase (GGDEF)-like protein/PAS domain S-box-containing protein
MDFAPISFLFLITGAISVVLALYALQRRTAPGSQPFSVFMLAIAVYSLGYALELSSPDLGTALFWSKVQYLGILTFPTTYLIFAIQYVGRGEWLNLRNQAMLFLIPALVMVLKLFDGSLHLIYASAQAEVINSTLYLTFTRGPIYLPIAIYQLSVVTVANILLIRKWQYSSRLYRSQTSVLLAAAVIPYLAYGIYLLDIQIHPALAGIDINPLSYAIWAAFASLAITRYRLLNLAPIAREALVERLHDAVVVLDSEARVVDVNPQAMRVFEWQKQPLGDQIEKVMDAWLDLNSLSKVEDSLKLETSMHKEGNPAYFEVTATVLKEKSGKRLGYLVVVHDISARKQVEQELHELSLRDDLTGLTNRRGFNLLSDQLMHMANRMQLNAILYYLDVDGLKSINDKYGHATGDQALVDTANILKSSFRASDIIARMGGDEFVIFALESDAKLARSMLERLEEAIKDHASLGRRFQLSISAGTSIYAWDNPTTLDQLLHEADQAMYMVKAAKRAKRQVAN